MQTDRPNQIFSIIKNTPNCLILRNKDQKFIRKTFVLKQQQLKQLVQRRKLNHPNLLALNHLQFSHFISQEKFAIEIVFEHYCRTLNQCLIGHKIAWEDSEIINTFEPIIELIEYLSAEKFVLNDFTLNNIAITEDQNIKYVDSFLKQTEIDNLEISNNTNNFNTCKIYDLVAENIFNLLFCIQTSKSWKARIKLLKQKRSKELVEFMYSILSKSSFNGRDFVKTKKIKKNIKVLKNIEDKVCKQQKEEKEKVLLFDWSHQGKENKLQQ